MMCVMCVMCACVLCVQVSKRRVRVLEFIKDFDKLRSGRVLKTLFRRALDMCGFDLTQAHLLCLEQRYTDI